MKPYRNPVAFLSQSLRAKVLWISLFLTLLPFFTLMVYSHLAARGAILRIQVPGIRTHAKDLADSIDDYLTERNRDLALIAHHPRIQAFIASPPEKRTALRSDVLTDLTHFIEVNPHYQVAYLLDPRGQVILSTAESPDAGTPSRSYFLRALAGEVYVSEPLALSGAGKAVIYFSVPVPRFPWKGAIGVAVLRVGAEELWKIVERDKDQVGKGSLAILFDEYGIRISYVQGWGRTFQAVLPLSPEAERRLLAEGRFGSPEQIEVLPFPDLAQGLREAARHPYFTHHVGSELYHAIAVPLRTRRWIVVENVPEPSFMAPISTITRNALWLGVGVAMLVFLVVRAGSRFIVNPLLLLSGTAQRIGDGDLSTSISLGRRDELGRLARALEEMRAKLAYSFEELQRRQEDMSAAYERERKLKGQLQMLYGQVEERAQELSQQLAVQGQYAEAVLRSIADGVYSTDLERCIQSWSRGAEAITGFEEEETLGRRCGDFLRHCNDGEGVLCDISCPISQALRQGQPVSIPETWTHTQNGGKVPISMAVSPIFDPQGEVTGAVGVFRDVSQERELRESIQQANRAKSAFLANMSHELRTPLTAIIGFSELLQEEFLGELNPKQSEYINDILQSGRHLLSLINDILDLSKVEAGEMELQPAELSLKSLLEIGLMMVRQMALKKGIGLSLEVEEGMDTLVGDERKFKQILFNLLSNAVKFTPQGGRVGVEAHRKGEWVNVTVWDTGIGISPQDQGRLFQPFQQIDSSLSRQYEGTGLGLALTQKLVDLHGGEIWVESTPREGSRFTFTLPLQGPLLRKSPSDAILADTGILLPYPSFCGHLKRMVQLANRQGRELSLSQLKLEETDVAVFEGGLPPAEGFRSRLRAAVFAIRDRIRPYDVIGMGEGNLALFLLLPDTPLLQAQEVTQRCRTLLEKEGFRAEDKVVELPRDGKTAEELIRAIMPSQ